MKETGRPLPSTYAEASVDMGVRAGLPDGPREEDSKVVSETERD